MVFYLYLDSDRKENIPLHALNWHLVKSKELHWNNSRLQASCQIAMAPLWAKPPIPHCTSPPQFYHSQPLLAPFLPSKLNDRWQKPDQQRPLSRNGHIAHSATLGQQNRGLPGCVRCVAACVCVYKRHRFGGVLAAVDAVTEEGWGYNWLFGWITTL